MRVFSVSPTNFRAGKIELDNIYKNDLTNYDSIKQLAREKHCDFLIEKKSNFKSAQEYDLFKVLARRKWINPKYVFGISIAAIPISATPEEIAKTIYQISLTAANITKEKAHELAKSFIR